jgi:ribonuclease III
MEDLEEIIGINFNNHLLLKEALTHRSYLNENPDWPVPHNERLEFLGDAVLELIVTEFLFEKYPDFNEGLLTGIRAALVNHSMLLRVSKDIGFVSRVFLSKGESKGSEKAKESIFANAVEALIGAIYIDQGYEKSEEFIKKFVLKNLDMVMEQKLYRDPKSILQEIAQEKFSITPRYEIIEENGPDHHKRFLVGAYLDNKLIAKGEGDSKQDAEREAASNSLKEIEKN